MVEQGENNNSDNGNHPKIGRYADYSSRWKWIVLVLILLAVLLFWPQLYTFVESQLEPADPGQTNDTQTGQVSLPSGFEETLEQALRHDREGDREQADRLFRQLIRQEARYTYYTPNMVLLFPRAADFYSRGDEIPEKEVENLYLDAIDAIRQHRPKDYYDYENVYRGLERHYLSLGRYGDAANQTRELLVFYRRYYKDDDDARYALILPATIRLGHHLMAAGQAGKARKVYQDALDMSRTRGGPVSEIEGFIQKTYPEDKAPASGTAAPPDDPAG